VHLALAGMRVGIKHVKPFSLGNGRKVFEVNDGGAAVVPAGTWHDVKNVGRVPLQVYTVYAPPNHLAGTVERTKAEAEKKEG
jgi:mannose-6-phosphate isomerase-like protein (cupin superfamily)